ncbi:PhzF family phenazine biosynthesis protein [Mycoplasmatota bacterium WC44]
MKKYMHKEVDVKIISAFTKDGKGGNLAGVVSALGLSKAEKQEIATQLNLSETVFIDNSNGYRFEYFTPVREIDFCGHATLAALSTIDFDKNIDIKVNRFDIKVSKKNDLVYFSSDVPKIKNISVNEEDVLDSLGITHEDIDMNIKVVYSGVEDIFISVKDAETLGNIDPDYKKIKEISNNYNVVGYHVFSLDSDCSAITRNFAPLYGINEESATGSANSALAYYLYENGIQKENYVFIQGVNLNKESLIYVDLAVGDDVSVRLSGNSTVIETRTIKLYGGK